MSTEGGQSFEVDTPILNSPYESPAEFWFIRTGEAPERRTGRRPALVYPPRNQKHEWDESDGTIRKAPEFPGAYELPRVNLIRERVADWRAKGYPGVTRTTDELLHYWRRQGRQHRLFFAQLEAVETVIFLREARQDFLQGIAIPDERLPDATLANGHKGFRRYACKMATGSGKSTVMGMLAAWSILNKLSARQDARFSDVVLIVCPNVTIRDRLRELDPYNGEASLYRTRDLIPPHLMPQLTQGRVMVTNWHVLEPLTPNVNGTSAKVLRVGVQTRSRQVIHIRDKTTTARGYRYLTLADYEKQRAMGILENPREERDAAGNLVRVTVDVVRPVESDTALVNRIFAGVGGKTNILVMNDEAHHAYRIHQESDEEEGSDEEEDADQIYKEATVWVEGLDRINLKRGINFCVDLSATPFFLGRVGQDTNRPFPWVVCDFGLVEAIESGLVKIPQMAVRDTTGKEVPGYFNVWDWILNQKLTAAERGGKRGNPKPEAILKYAHHPVAMLGGLWEADLKDWKQKGGDPRPPVFILVCKNTQIARVVYEWLADDKCPTGIPSANIAGFRNANGERNTIRVDSKVVHETDTGTAKSDETRWMRFTLDTVGKQNWPAGAQHQPIYPEGFEELAKKLGRPLHPPGRDIRCIVSVGMLTEGWDCNTVQHIVGLRPFMSQLLCEQVVGRGLRRVSYELTPDGKFTEEVAKVFGVPFEVIPFKANAGAPARREKRHHIHAVAQRAQYEIRFPRVEGYTQAIRNRITVNWDTIPRTLLEPGKIPPEVQMKGVAYTNRGKLSLDGPGHIEQVDLTEWRAKRRIQELVFDVATRFTRHYSSRESCTIPAHVLFPQVMRIVERYVQEKVDVQPPADKRDLFLAPYYGWMVEILLEAVRPDTSQGEAPEVPRFEQHRGDGTTADVDFWTSREPVQAIHSHLNAVVPDTKTWEQSAAYYIDTHPAVAAFAKNAGLGFAIPYVHNGQGHDYEPDFIIRLNTANPCHLILEVKGFDPKEEHKKDAAVRWVNAVNAAGTHGRWEYAVVKKVTDVRGTIDAAIATRAVHT